MIWIIGGSGYVGTHLKREWEKKNIAFISFDKKGFNDLTTDSFLETIEVNRIQAIVFLAGVVRTDTSSDLIETNLVILTRFLKFMEVTGAKLPIFFTSSLYVYSKSRKPLRVGKSPCNPEHVYGFSKKICESVLQFYAAKLNFPLWIGRAANLVAATKPLNKASFLSNWHRSILENKRIQVNTRAIRDFVSIADFADGLWKRINQIRPSQGIMIENVCSGKPVILLEWAKFIRETAIEQGTEIQVEEFDPGVADVLLGEPEPDCLWGNGLNPTDISLLVLDKLN